MSWYDIEGRGDVGLDTVDRALSVGKINAGSGFVSSDVFIRVMREFQKAGVPVIDCCGAALQIGDAVAKEKMTYVFQLSPTVKDIASSVAAAVAEWVKSASRQGLAMLIVEQNVEAILNVADRVFVLEMGRNAFDRTPAVLRSSERIRNLYLGSEAV